MLSCKKNGEQQIVSSNNEVVYSDSFNPPDWESPVSRKNIKSGDKDIGIFIKSDAADLKNRSILLTVEQFIKLIKEKKTEDLNSIMMESAYHSFVLRYPDLSFKESYTLRVEQPADPSKNPLWIRFKLILTDKSYIGRLELEFSGNLCKINDFDDDFFKNLKDRNSK